MRKIGTKKRGEIKGKGWGRKEFNLSQMFHINKERNQFKFFILVSGIVFHLKLNIDFQF